MASELERLREVLADRYRVERELGRGGMATVYRAHDIRHDRPVALKVLKPELAAALGLERFLREITVTARLDHPHILPLLDSGKADGTLYYVMPFVQGESLRDRLNREKQLPVDDALEISRQVADALSYAHGHGVVHRDIKPENILLAAGHARVADFGIARALSAAGGESVTQTGVAIGTPAYMSPEQASGERGVDPRADVYSLACVAYEMLAGQPPYTGATPEAILARKSLEAVPSLRVVRDAVPPGVERAIAKGLAKVPADRFATASQFAEALHRAGRTSEPPAPSTDAIPRRRVLLVAAAAIAVVSAAWWGLSRLDPSPARIDSLVVLPFINRTGDPEQDYFVDGMHDALIGELGRISTLRVISRTSAIRYKGTSRSVRDIARELDVDALVEATLFRTGDSVRIHVRLITPLPERQLWAGSYVGDLRNASSLLAQSAEAIAGQIEVRLTQEERARLASRDTVDPMAFELLLRGQHQVGLNRLREARSSFQRALQRDSTYASAYAGLAHTYNVMGYFSSTSPKDIYPHARKAALSALRFDETLAEGHVQLAWVLAVDDWDWAGAERAFRRALELNSGSVLAHFWYAHLLHWQLRYAEAIAEMDKTIRLDPLALTSRASGAGLFRRVRRCDLALRQIAKARELQGEMRVSRPGYIDPDFTAGQCHLQHGRTDEALRLMEHVVHTSGPDLLPRYKAELAHAYGVVGRKSEAQALLREVLAVAEQQYVAPYLIALAYVGLGDSDSAFAWLERAYNVRDNWLPFVNVEPRWDPVRSDPRFESLLRRIKLKR